MHGQPGHLPGHHTTAYLVATQFPEHGCTNSKTPLLVHRLLGSLTYFSDMLFMGVCTTSNWKTSGQLVQELMSVLYSTILRKNPKKCQFKVSFFIARKNKQK